MKLSDMKVDTDAIEVGQWVDGIPEMGGLRLRVRGMQNAEYRKLMTKLIDAVPRAKRPGGRIAPEEQDRVMSECLAATVLLGWDGIEDDDGKPLPFSREMAAKMLADPGLRRFRDAVVYAASTVGEAPVGEAA